jgi:uncharacterized protein with PIN domain
MTLSGNSRSKEPRFILDSMLGKLARFLRIMGYDSLYFKDAEDSFLIYIALEEGDRILLTKDVKLIEEANRLKIKAKLIRSNHVEEQLKELEELISFRMGNSRCPICNGYLYRVEKEEIQGEIPDFVWYTNNEFYRCTNCKKIYWKGSHIPKLKERI